MVKELEHKREALADLCRRYGVARLELFGSAASETFDPKASDLDFLVTFESRANASLFDRYFDLKEDLEALFGREVDLVMEGALRNPYFIESVNKNRRLLYAA